MDLRKSSIVFLLLVLMASCDKSSAFDEYKKVPSEGWHRDSIMTFDLPEVDTMQTYNLFVNLRTNDKYPFNNLFLIVSLDEPSRRTIVDTLEYEMADPEGNMLGEGFSDIKESKLFYKERVKFKKGPYKIRIQQALRETGKVGGVQSLQGITDVGLRIENATK